MCWNVKTRQALTTIVLQEEHLTYKSDDRVENLSTILVRGGGNFNDPILKSKSLNAREGRGRDVDVSS